MPKRPSLLNNFNIASEEIHSWVNFLTHHHPNGWGWSVYRRRCRDRSASIPRKTGAFRLSQRLPNLPTKWRLEPSGNRPSTKHERVSLVLRQSIEIEALLGSGRSERNIPFRDTVSDRCGAAVRHAVVDLDSVQFFTFRIFGECRSEKLINALCVATEVSLALSLTRQSKPLNAINTTVDRAVMPQLCLRKTYSKTIS